jgi:hypothetical protein
MQAALFLSSQLLQLQSIPIFLPYNNLFKYPAEKYGFAPKIDSIFDK